MHCRGHIEKYILLDIVKVILCLSIILLFMADANYSPTHFVLTFLFLMVGANFIFILFLIWPNYTSLSLESIQLFILRKFAIFYLILCNS